MVGNVFFERAEIKNTLAYLRLINNRNDNEAFVRVVNFPPRGIGEKTIQTIVELASRQEQSLWNCTKDVISGGICSPRICKSLSHFINIIETLAQDHEHLSLEQLIRSTIGINRS